MNKGFRSHLLTRVLPLTIFVLLVVAFFTYQKTAGWDTVIPRGLTFGGAIAFDSSGQAWFSKDRALTSYDAETHTFPDAEPAIRANDRPKSAFAIAFDPEGNLWVGNSEGLHVFNGDTWTTYTTDNSKLPRNGIWDLAFDQDGKAWISTMDSLLTFDGKTWINHADKGALVVSVDPSGRVWIGSNEGVGIFNGEGWITYNTGNSDLIADKVKAIAFDSQSRAWIGTRGGVSVFDGNTWTTFTVDNSGLVSNSVTHLAVDQASRVWIGTSYDGISVFDGATWIPFTADNSGLPVNKISGIDIDPSGRAWISVHFVAKETHALVLAPPEERLSSPFLASDTFKAFLFYFSSRISIWLTAIGLSVLFFALLLRVNRAYIGVVGWLVSLPLIFQASDPAKGTLRFDLSLESILGALIFVITILGAIGSILAALFAKSSEKREKIISKGFWWGIGLGIGSIVLILLIMLFSQS